MNFMTAFWVLEAIKWGTWSVLPFTSEICPIQSNESPITLPSHSCISTLIYPVVRWGLRGRQKCSKPSIVAVSIDSTFPFLFTLLVRHGRNISGGKGVIFIPLTHLQRVLPWLGGSSPPCAILDQCLHECPHIPETREKAAEWSCHATDSWPTP